MLQMFAVVVLVASSLLASGAYAQQLSCPTTPTPTLYNDQTQRCCKNTSTSAWEVKPATAGISCVGPNKASPGSSVSTYYDKSTTAACSDGVVSFLTYDPSSQFCCSGVVQGSKVGDAAVFSIDGDHDSCCATIAYNSANYHCCNGILIVIDSLNPAENVCCGSVTIDPLSKFCCAGTAYNIPAYNTAADDSCCYDQITYNHHTKKCKPLPDGNGMGAGSVSLASRSPTLSYTCANWVNFGLAACP